MQLPIVLKHLNVITRICLNTGLEISVDVLWINQLS